MLSRRASRVLVLVWLVMELSSLREELLKVVQLTFENLVFSSEGSVVELQLVVLFNDFFVLVVENILLVLLLLAGADRRLSVLVLLHSSN